MSKPLTDRPMDEITLEASLKAVLTRQPEPAFVDALEQRLLASQRVAPAGTARGRKPSVTRWRDWWAGIGKATPRLRWAALPLAVLALLLAALLIIGPERAWAGLQAWLGYVPGVGFVDLDESRLLARPARVTREGITLEVVEVVAGLEDAVVVVEIEGLPPEDRFRPQYMPPPSEPLPLLRLPGGDTLSATGVSADRAQAIIVFPALPADAYRVTLELPRLPLVPAGEAPENWTVPLILQPASGELVTEMYPRPYRPEGATDTQQEIALSVLEVAHGEEATALQVRAHWNKPGWRFHGFWVAETVPRLRDEQGNVYERSLNANLPLRVTVEASNPAATPSPPPGGYTEETTLLFAPVPAGVETLTLEVEALDFQQKASGELHLDLGPAPSVGQRWPLDENWTIAGYPVHVRGVQLLRRDDPGLPYQLVFDMDVAESEGSAMLRSLRLSADFNYLGSTSGNYQRDGALVSALLLPKIPDRPFTVRADLASLVVEGPWEVTWQVP
jgi:hypothetical protein